MFIVLATGYTVVNDVNDPCIITGTDCAIDMSLLSIAYHFRAL